MFGYIKPQRSKLKFKLDAMIRCLLPVACCLAATAASAQDKPEAFPSREVRFVCAFPAGSGADVYVRYFAEKMRPHLKQTVIVENRAGANGNIATEYTARAKPDGYTVYVHAPSALAANMHLFAKPPVDIRTTLQVVTVLNQQPFMLTVAVGSPAKTMAELVEVVKAKGDKASYATTAPTGKIAAFLFNEHFGLKAVEVAYRTGPDSLNDMASGRIDFAMHDPVLAVAQTNAGKLRMLGVTTKERSKALPALPSLYEQGVKSLDVPGWWAAMVPAGTPKPIVDRLNKMFVDVVESEETRKFFAQFGADAMTSTPEAGQKRMIEDVDNWGRNIEKAKIPKQG